MNSKQNRSKEDEVVERMARVGFETMHEDKWDELLPSSALRYMWLGVASEMLTELRRVWEQAKSIDLSELYKEVE